MHTSSLKNKDWKTIELLLHLNGYAIIPNAIGKAQCDKWRNSYHHPETYRKTVKMERYRFGLGEYKYFAYPLPEEIEKLRAELYAYLAPVANTWMEQLRMDTHYPDTHEELKKNCHAKGQRNPTVLILKYNKGGYNTLHQDLYGDVFFPLQAVLFLTEPEQDYTGGEFVLLQQTPRAQSKAIVLTPKKGDLLIFTTNFKPIKGTKGYYRITMKHGVSEVTTGERYTLGVIFHDALS